MKKMCLLISLLIFSSCIQSSDELQPRTPGTITNITHGDMKVQLYERPYSAQIFGFNVGEQDQQAIEHTQNMYIHAYETVVFNYKPRWFNNNLAGISLPTLQNKNPEIYLLDERYAYTLEFNSNNGRIVRITQDGIAQEAMTFKEKRQMEIVACTIHNHCKTQFTNTTN